MAVVEGAGSALGVATLTGAAALLGVLGGLAAGESTVWGESHPLGYGTSTGVGTATGTGSLVVGATTSMEGGSGTTAAGGTTYLSTGLAVGAGTLEWDYIVEGAGQADGSSTVTGSGSLTLLGRGRASGVGRFIWAGAPRPILGVGTMVAHVEVEHHLPAIEADVADPTTFRWLQHLQRGDLPIYIWDRRGRVSPKWVRYTMYQVLPSGVRKRVGPARKTPVQGAVGEYYVSGRAGETGQPGDWVIYWEYRRTLDSVIQNKEMDFRVLDAALASDPRDTTVRHRKYGWS